MTHGAVNYRVKVVLDVEKFFHYKCKGDYNQSKFFAKLKTEGILPLTKVSFELTYSYSVFTGFIFHTIPIPVELFRNIRTAQLTLNSDDISFIRTTSRFFSVQDSNPHIFEVSDSPYDSLYHLEQLDRMFYDLNANDHIFFSLDFLIENFEEIQDRYCLRPAIQVMCDRWKKCLTDEDRAKIHLDGANSIFKFKTEFKGEVSFKAEFFHYFHTVTYAKGCIKFKSPVIDNLFNTDIGCSFPILEISTLEKHLKIDKIK